MMAVEGPPISNGLANIYIVRGTILLYFIPLSVLVVMALLKLQSAEFTTRPTFLNGGEYVLLFTACGESSYFVLRGIAGIGCLVSDCNTNYTSIPAEDICPSHHVFLSQPATADDSYQVDSYLTMFLLSYAVIMYLQVWLQSLFLIIVKRKQLTTTWIRTLLIWMSVLNFSTWLVYSLHFGLKIRKKRSVMPVMDGFYSDETTHKIVAITLPILMLFRFHSAIISIELFNES